MNLFELYTALNHRLAKDKQGNAFSPDDFNNALIAVNGKLYGQELDKVVTVSPEGKTVFLQDEKAEINWFRTVSTLKDNELPLGYRQFISIKRNGVAGDVITPKDYDNYTINVLRPLTSERPVVTFYPTYVLPQDGTYILTYYRLSVTPYMDYCIDADGNTVFMPVGSTIASQGGNLLDAQGNTLKTSVNHLYATSFPYTSTTRELDWRESFHDKFINPMCEWGAMNLRDAMAEQISLQK